ncbi:hypothetical protein AB0M46_10720 [Dactylosporangium sp. NPDC051485]|uniref:hypothetical protein n=1 Tax=Dactylosporangium sp. NPDC051485 TaxID=3154846 RepID=UPI0034451BE6
MLDDEDSEPRRSWGILIVAGAIAALVLIGAALYIGLDLRSANQTAADRAAEDEAPRPTATALTRLPASVERFEALVGVPLDPDTSGKTARVFVDMAQFGGSGDLSVLMSYSGPALFTVTCEANPAVAGTATPPEPGDGSLTLKQVDRDHVKDCAAATLTDDWFTQPTLQWLAGRAQPAAADNKLARWSCGPVAMEARQSPSYFGIVVKAGPGDQTCGAVQ